MSTLRRRISQRAGDMGGEEQTWSAVPRPRGGAGRLSLPMAALGVLLVAGCALGALVMWTGAGQRVDVLAAARDITAGHVLEPADLRTVSVAGIDEVSVVPASRTSQLIGLAAAVPVPAGALVPAGLVRRDGLLLPRGAIVMSIAVQAGAVPPQAGPGSAVRVLPIPPSATSPGRVPGRGVDAVLLSVAPASSTESQLVVSLQLAEADAAALATSGDVAVALLPGPRQ
ncbi:SAF domain-containing protein [Pseudonocardia sp. TRM90224]|uniref:SAF domain-containing protein n=1 Tax=Pseudonocardia sp. TRM90224 TaxID=2812678 RepID=UPI001E5F545D|nr:SAF domain-containing protein [Pseudonocardia sp. TRM90224]